MSTGSARSPSGDDLQFPGGFVLVRRLRGDATAGCGAVEDSAGRTYFARWSASAGVPTPDSDAGRPASTAPENEHRVLTSLTSLGVPVAVDLVRGRGRCVSISTWIEGESASVVGRFDDVELERAAAQLVSIAARAHRCGWVHGDIKPANVIVGPDGSVHLIDWAGACRIGERAPPGTLGYAPPWAWCDNHKAEPRDDYYALATTLRELRIGRIVTAGVRSDVLDRQNDVDFADADDAPATVARLFACAAAGTDLATAGDVRDLARGPGVRKEAVESRMIRREIVAAARRIAAETRAPLDPTYETLLPLDPRDLPCAADALAAELRVEQGCNALRWPSVVERVLSTPWAAAHDGTTSRVDRLRDRNALIELEGRRLLATLDQPVLIVCAGDVAETDAPAWSQLRDGAAGSGDGSRPSWSVVMLEDAPDRAVATVDRSREALEEVLDSAIADRLAVAVSSRWTGSVRAIVDYVLSLATTGRLIWANGLVDIVESATALGVDSPTDAVASAEQKFDMDWCGNDGERWSKAIEASLDAGESAAVRGDLGATLRACMRVHTYLATASHSNPEQALRLADLWSECGRGDAAEAVLRMPATQIRKIDQALRLARLYASRGDSAALADALGVAKEFSCTNAQSVDVARFEALSLVLKRDFIGAYERLRAAIDRRAEMSPQGQLWLLTTLGNVLRMRGRAHSACRLLQLVKQQASRVGSARLQVAVASNLILARVSRTGPSQLAAEAWTIAQRCFAWGMTPEALINSLTASTYWIIAGDGLEAKRIADEVLSMDVVRQSPNQSAIVGLREARLAAMDIEADWTSIGLAMRAPGGAGCETSAHACLLRDELGIQEYVLVRPRKSGRRNKRDRRCIDAMLSIAMRDRPSNRRVRTILRQFVGVVNTWLPITGHAARMAVRHARDAVSSSVILQVSREDAGNDDEMHRLAIALHAAALAWAPRVDGEAATWFAAHAPIDDRRRPAGIRLWEWRLAIRRAAIESGAAEHDDQDAEVVIEEMESTVRQLWADVRIGYARRLPLYNVARLSGCEVAEEELRTTSEDPAAPFERLRSVLFRRRVSEERGGKRAAGLERVLRGALRLQSATDIDGLLGEIVAGVAAVCRAERAVVVYGGGRRHGRAKVAANGAVSSIAQSEAEVSLTAVARVRETKRACLIDDACGDERLGDRPSVMQFRPRSLIVAPLQTLGEFLGYIYVENRSAAKSFSGSDVELVEGFAAQAAFALENAQLVDELRRSCEELDRARSDAVRAESLRVVGRMASEVAHDFNNLLTAILGETQLLMQADDTRDRAESLAVIERAALDGADVVRRMQATTRIKDPSAFVVLSLKDVVRNVLDMMRWRATSERVSVRCDVDPGLRVRGVPSELREVLTNLVVNALDAMPGGGELRIVGTQSGRDAVIDVEDTGHGMDARTAAQAFDPFFSTKGEKGNGLGLSIAYGIMQRHGGDIQVASRVGSGTRMRLTIPLARESADRSAQPNDECVGPRRQPARALIVDDEPAIARVLSTMLRRSGVDVEVSIGGRAGLASLRGTNAEFDLVITDVNMPDVNGIEVAIAAMKKAQPAQVILMSGSLGGREEATAQALGVQVLRKPFTVKDIDRLVLGVS